MTVSLTASRAGLGPDATAGAVRRQPIPVCGEVRVDDRVD